MLPTRALRCQATDMTATGTAICNRGGERKAKLRYAPTRRYSAAGRCVYELARAKHNNPFLGVHGGVRGGERSRSARGDAPCSPAGDHAKGTARPPAGRTGRRAHQWVGLILPAERA